MHALDWILTAVPLVALVIFAAWTRRFVRGVADYMAGGRVAGRYLLANAQGESGSGVTNTVSFFEMYMICGFIVTFWGWVTVPVGIALAITGFVLYRYRETRCLTMAQFFEQRYSPNLRLFMGFMGFLAGVLNYGIFPFVSSQLFVYFLDLPACFQLADWIIPTYIPIMAVYLAISAFMVTFGGQVTLMVTDCVEGIFSHAVYIVLIAVLLVMIPWQHVYETLTGMLVSVPHAGDAAGAASRALTTPSLEIQPEHSPVNPFDAFKTKSFNVYTTLLGVLAIIYGTGCWQGGHMFRSAARTAHEARMGNILANWRGYARTLVLVVLVICTMTFLRHPAYEKDAAAAKERISLIHPVKPQTVEAYNIANAKLQAEKPKDLPPVGSQRWYEEGDARKVNQLQKQQSVCVALGDMLPVGIKGVFVLILIMGLFAGDGNHLLSWSSIFVQDVVVPVRRRITGRDLSPEKHLSLLRWAVVGVATASFFISVGFCVMPLEMPIWFWWGITGAIYNAGAGAVIIGGLYTRFGNSTGAWASVIIGPSLSAITMVIDFLWPSLIGHTFLGYKVPAEKPYNMLIVGTFILYFSGMCYVVFSLLRRQKPFELDRLLHRGKFADENSQKPPTAQDRTGRRLPVWLDWKRVVGVDSNFTRTDTFVATFIFYWSVFLVLLLVFALAWKALASAGIVNAWTNSNWMTFWLIFGLIIPGIFTVTTLVWFAIGGWIDIRQFFHDMRHLKRDSHDDGQSHMAAEKPEAAAPPLVEAKK